MNKILVIENEAKDRNWFLEIFKTHNFLAIGAENKQIGIQSVEAESPDLIICSILNQKDDVYNVISTLRQKKSTAIIPLILIGALGSLADLRKGIELGADDYLLKPCTAENILRASLTCLQKRMFFEQYYMEQARQVLETLYTSSEPQTQPGVGNEFRTNSIFPNIPKLEKVFSFIEDNYCNQISLADVALTVGYSASYLTQLVRCQTGKTVQNWIIERRIAQACFLLLETEKTVEQIAINIGYRDVSYFFQQFRQHKGITPQNWKKVHKPNFE